jgi:DNA polymerase-1
LEARTTGGVTTALGRWRPIPDINSDDWGKKAHAERVAINTPVQSLASDLTLIKLDEIARHFPGNSGVHLIATVHDSILFMISDLALHLRRSIRDMMEDTSTILDKFGVDFDVPLKVDIKTGAHWGV